ncbi:hypothetical protein ABIE32_001656 [Comamonas sp. 4034]
MKPRLSLKHGYWLCLGGVGFGIGPTPQFSYQQWEENCRWRNEQEFTRIYSEIKAMVQLTWQALEDARK